MAGRIAPGLVDCEQKRLTFLGNNPNVYYYVQDLDECHFFHYGGSKGNENNFKTQQECEAKCLKDKLKSPCHQPLDLGRGMGVILRYAYSQELDECRFFQYRGDGGNENNFNTKRECEARCVITRSPWSQLVVEPTEDTSFLKKQAPHRT
ncbi:Kunitz BPTI domain containing protein [Trichuris trichiura]|uniref:Kunitz BPTI domain containing protein n=1 Tax=Trichuris trichiura TaxID=36087 RepID=A0A077ZH70_TRITR|nr:Kunitz BPTI domain containing protein [Trichuris trichiura]